MDIEKFIEVIQEKLMELGYKEKLISYEEIQGLHKLYGKEMPEKVFAENVLQISNANYKRIRCTGTKTRILKVKQIEIENIKKILIEQGYSGKRITYKELQKLYQDYENEMEEVKFAQEVLGITYNNYRKIQTNGATAKILKKIKKFSEDEIQRIQDILRTQGYTGNLIDYNEFQELYQKYGNEVEEVKFAQEVLEMSYSGYFRIKRGDGKATILKPKELSNEKITYIQNKLKEQGYSGKSVTYDELHEFYLEYGIEMEEVTFAQKVLEISYGSYKNIKNTSERARILKGKKTEISDNVIKEIQNKLIDQGYINKNIKYKDLQLLYQNYGQGMKENEFAQQVLEISYYSYYDLKNKGRNAIILKENKKETSKEEIEEIQIILKEQGYEGKLINYEEFQELYKKYGTDMEEVKFAQEVLLISYANFFNIKNKDRKARILNLRELSKDVIKDIQISLKEQGYTGKLIGYNEFQKLYKCYGNNMGEVEFANKVLRISENYFYRVRNKGRKARVLKERQKEISEQEIEQIQYIIKEQGYDRVSINYDELKEMYKNYGNEMGEIEFAQKVLGISYDNYRSMKSQGTRARILCLNKKISLLEEVYFGESRYYTKSELESICTENNLSMSNLINQLLCKHSQYKSEYEELVRNGKVWIGNTSLSEDFIEKNYTKMQQLAKRASTFIKRKYNINYNKYDEDQIEDAILYVIENRGDIEKNFEGNEEITKKLLYNSLRKYIQIRVLSMINITAKILSFNQKYKRKDFKEGRELQEVIPSTENIESKVLSTINDEKTDIEVMDISEKCIQELRYQIEEGRSREEALEITAKKLNLDKQQMIDAMQNYLVTKGKVKITNQSVELVDDVSAR